MNAGQKTKGFTLIELLVVIAIISILATILLPSLKKARELANISVCMSNLRGLPVSFAMHLADNNGAYPNFYVGGTNGSWNNRFRELDYIDNIDALFCPSGGSPEIPWSREGKFTRDYIDYGYNIALCRDPDKSYAVNLASESDIRRPSGTLLAADARVISSWFGENAGRYMMYPGAVYKWQDEWGGMPKARHDESICNVAWVDGHVSSVEQPDKNDPYSFYWDPTSELQHYWRPDSPWAWK